MAFGAIVNGIDSLISLSIASLLVHRNATDFCALILYPATLLSSCIISSSLLVVYCGFSTQSFMPSLKSERLSSSWTIWMPFISLCCLIAKAKTSNTMLSNSGKSGHPCLVPDLREKTLSFSPLRMILALGRSYMAFMISRYDPSIPTFLRVFIKKGCCIFSNVFSASMKRIIWFLSSLLLM